MLLLESFGLIAVLFYRPSLQYMHCYVTNLSVWLLLYSFALIAAADVSPPRELTKALRGYPSIARLSPGETSRVNKSESPRNRAAAAAALVL